MDNNQLQETRWQRKLYSFLEEPENNKISFVFNSFIYVLIIISIVNLMLETVGSISDHYHGIITGIRNIIMPIFVIEYFLRLYASGAKEKHHGIKGKIRYIFSWYSIIDILAISPYLLTFAGFDGSMIRSLRLFRIFRIFRMKKYTVFIALMKQILFNIKEELVVLLLYAVIIIVILSFIIFEVEHEAQPEVFSNVFETMWWAVATLTTVGYGDMYPITVAGKIITAIITVVGIGFVAIPGGMFASEFLKNMEARKKKDMISESCPLCGGNNIDVSENPILKMGTNESHFEQAYYCKDCDFHWLN